jgi:hypothetical protein
MPVDEFRLQNRSLRRAHLLCSLGLLPQPSIMSNTSASSRSGLPVFSRSWRSFDQQVRGSRLFGAHGSTPHET